MYRPPTWVGPCACWLGACRDRARRIRWERCRDERRSPMMSLPLSLIVSPFRFILRYLPLLRILELTSRGLIVHTNPSHMVLAGTYGDLFSFLVNLFGVLFRLVIPFRSFLISLLSLFFAKIPSAKLVRRNSSLVVVIECNTSRPESTCSSLTILDNAKRLTEIAYMPPQ